MNRKVTFGWFGISLGMLSLIILAWLGLNREVTKPLASSVWAEITAPPLVGVDSTQLTQTGLKACREDRFATAADIFALQQKETGESADLTFSLAYCLLRDKQVKKSIPYFLGLSLNTGKLQEAAMFYLALAYLANEELQAGKALLVHLSQDEVSSFSGKASGLLQKMQQAEN